MESVDVFLDHLQKDQQRRQHELLEKEKLRKEELETLTQTLSQLKEEKQQCVLAIDKNLSSITSSKHSIHKTVRETKDDAGLPISNTSRTHALNFFNDTMTFINSQSENSGVIGTEENVNTQRLSAAIQNSNENSKKEVVKVNNKVAAVQTVIESIPVLSGYITSVNDQEEEPQFDTSLTLI
ncbi:uncharacterized protein LOC107037721 [Diachasma alloeum]|uniref:uncharacterized protein LOC107037721 n=1 Tax=Diachasma alloeum TaxID=454923 RepID=UPI0007384063|nr:uncharacterized protein LOC107037721 [Diachasma alloeum]